MMKKWNEHAKKGEWDEILKEADRIEKELGPDLEYPASDEEVQEAYQRLMTRIKAEGLYDKLVENEDSEKESSPRPACKAPSEPEKPSRLHVFGKYVAMFAITLIGIFVLSMSSEANRQWVLRKMSYIVGNDDLVISFTNSDKNDMAQKEENAKSEIESTYFMDVPVLFYKPEGFGFVNYNVGDEGNVVVIYYKNGEKLYSLYISKDEKMTYSNIRPYGKVIDQKNINGKIDDAIEYYVLKDENEKEPMLLGAWEYNNTFYQLLGKMKQDEFIKILENICY